MAECKHLILKSEVVFTDATYIGFFETAVDAPACT